jgi:uncharacterized protein YndB with AHSA1/START domain
MTDERRAITIVEELPYPPEKVWLALTEPRLMAKWLMPTTNFEARVGQEFQMQGTPVPAVNFSGVVLAKVLELTPHKRMSISWTDEPRTVDWTVTWSLEPQAGGTRLTMVHDGFDLTSERQQMSYKIMGGGWVGMNHKIGEVLRELEEA